MKLFESVPKTSRCIFKTTVGGLLYYNSDPREGRNCCEVSAHSYCFRLLTQADKAALFRIWKDFFICFRTTQARNGLELLVCGWKEEWEVSSINTNCEENRRTWEVAFHCLRTVEGHQGSFQGSPQAPWLETRFSRVAGAAGKLSLGQMGSGSDLLEKVGTRSEGTEQENAGDSQAWRGSRGCSRRPAIPLSH